MAELIPRWPRSTPSGSLQSNLKGWIQSRALNSISEVWASADHFTSGFSDSDTELMLWRISSDPFGIKASFERNCQLILLSEEERYCDVQRETEVDYYRFWPLCPKRPSVMKASLPLCCADTNRPGFQYSCTDNAFPMQMFPILKG